MKHYSHYSLAVLIPMAIWGVGSPVQAADDSTPDETKRSAAAKRIGESRRNDGRYRSRADSPGPRVSTITADEIRKHPPARDVSELIRTQPGVNLTGNSTSGQRGNNRQVDIRGMGPENTLILVDGKPVTSRNSVRYGWRGDPRHAR
ncbi:Enterobactin outer-membrane receptor [Raoultella terrigena]|uniref:Enterobactin outer-membrane receptor n=1 Tax=Raoultella terrigena TaxID=577 RepID=A0A4U9CW11_RAOTE|nr:Enterobactin outer-membrane receptor [Raoultella terrigena]